MHSPLTASSRARLTVKMFPEGTLHIGHLRGRVLPVAVAKFIDLMIIALGERFPEDLDTYCVE